jgi:hypothetical protein
MDMAPIEVLLMILYVYLYEHDALYKVVPVTSRLH